MEENAEQLEKRVVSGLIRNQKSVRAINSLITINSPDAGKRQAAQQIFDACTENLQGLTNREQQLALELILQQQQKGFSE